MSVKTSRVFVSHTSDLARVPVGRSFVQGALDAVARLGMLAVDMRYFAAREDQPADYCRRRVRECDIFLAVVGFRYGSLVPGEAVSYTELEFDEATTSGLPRLVFLQQDTTLGEADADRTAVDGFRERLRQAGLICVEFSTVEGLELAIVQALTEWAQEPVAVPRQLPRAVTHFAGRVDQLTTLTELLPRRVPAGGAVVISAIDGTAGVGKTALAIHWAHQVAHHFPDGQLYVDLRGFDPSGQAMAPGEALRRFLDALEVDPQRIPADLDGKAALYRSQMAGRRMLIVLDNARDSAQVRPMLPGTPGCLVVVTSRNQLPGLVAADGAHPLSLDLPTVAEARELLANRLGAKRTTAEPGAVDEIIEACARLPLALAIVAARAANRPMWSLAALACELRETTSRLDVLASGEDVHTDVRAVLSWSARALTSGAERLFRLLGLHPGPSITVPAAASLAAAPVAEVRGLLAELTRANLIVESAPGRYTFHDLLRAYARDLVDTHEPGEWRQAATQRMLDHYLHSAHSADRLLHPGRDQLTLTPPGPQVTAEHPDDEQRATEWFTAERAVLLAAVEHAAITGFDTHTWQLAWTLAPYLDRREHWHDLAATGRTAVAAAERLADLSAQTTTHRLLARAYIQLGRLDDAHTQLKDALALTTQTGDQEGQAHVHHSFAYMWERQGRHADALHHVQQTLELYRAAGHRRGQARALNNIGWCHSLLGEHRQAVTACEQALELLEDLGDRFGQANTWDSLGHAHRHLGHHDVAVACFQRAIDLHRELDDPSLEAETLVHLGDTHEAGGDLGAAREAWGRALTIMKELNHPDTEPVRVKLGSGY
ncbi:MAG TPA: tetratricopeptide repeat protein [Candidatus Limnocylindrales bacterium]|nr:tetratricopeptide repeat protein [Candidatus Limnocylindrales bacterium]